MSLHPPTPEEMDSTPSAGSVTLAMMANLAANSIILNNTGSPATPIAGTPAQLNALLGLTGLANVSTGAVPVKTTTGFTAATQDNVPDGVTYKQYNPAAAAVTGGTIQGVVTKQTIVPYAVASRTLVAADRDAMGTDTYATAVTVTLPQDSACTDIQIGHHGDLFNLGAGTVTLAAGSGATVVPATGISYPTNSGASWLKIAANKYAVVGKLS